MLQSMCTTHKTDLAVAAVNQSHGATLAQYTSIQMRRFLWLLRSARARSLDQQQQQQQQLAAYCLPAASVLQQHVAQQHLWHDQQPWLLQQQQQQQQPWLLHHQQPLQHACTQFLAQPGLISCHHHQLQQQHRSFAAAADPARAIADTMHDVAQRKLADVQRQYEALQAKMAGLSPGSDTYQKLVKEAAALGPLVEGYQELRHKQQDLEGLHDVLSSEEDKELQQLAKEEMQQVQQQVDELQHSLLLALLPADVEDDGNVILEIRSSVGGEWAGGFAADLLDMYRLFAADQGWRFEVLETKPTDMGGIKSATAVVSGPGAFGHLRWETGVHRATMVPDNDRHGRMQTGTAVVIVLPEASDVQVKLNESDLRIETCRASGKGGQHVNTTDSAVRVVHIPTGLVATCQNERSQVQNKMMALKVLRAKLHEAEVQKQAASLSAQRKAAAGSANSNERIRSYNYQDGRVSDHRIGVTLQVDVSRFMSDGQRLAELIQAVKLQHQQEQLKELLESSADT